MFEETLPRVHGGTAAIESLRLEAQRLDRGTRRTIVDMSTCVDAFGLLEPVRRALSRVEETASYRDYPDPESRRARARLAEFAGVPCECIDVGPGAAELIWTLTRTLVRPGEVALAWKPCFSEIEHAVAAVNGRMLSHWFGEESVEREVARFFDVVANQRPKLAYLCAPTCPRGQWIPSELLSRGSAQAPDTAFVIDQSYLGLSGHGGELATQFPSNVVLLRSLTKELAVPGVRVGYAVMSAELRTRLQSQRPFWCVGAHAQAVLEAYVECLGPLAARRELLLDKARGLATDLRHCGLAPQLEDTHYFTVDVNRDVPTETAAGFAQRLLGTRIAVRDCTSFGLPNAVRVVAHPEQHRLVEVCASEVATGEREEKS